MKKLSKKEILELRLLPMPIEEKDVLEKNPDSKGKDVFKSGDKFFVGCLLYTSPSPRDRG